METLNDFDGVFRFTNPTDEDFTFLWNNKEYTYPAQSTTPMLIPNETLENIQEIRKKAAYKLAVREFYNGKDFARLNNAKTATPATFDEKVLEPMIEMCLKPLPVGVQKVKDVKTSKVKAIATKPIDDKSFDPKASFEVE